MNDINILMEADESLMISKDSNFNQEYCARIWTYNKLIKLNGIIEAYKCGCKSICETAKYLEVTEEFLIEALEYYKSKYGMYTRLNEYIIYFEPGLQVLAIT